MNANPLSDSFWHFIFTDCFLTEPHLCLTFLSTIHLKGIFVLRSKFFLAALLTFPASFSFAIPATENVDGAHILEVLNKSCPEKFSEAMIGANGVEKVTFREKINGRKTLWRYQINTVKRTPPPFFKTEKVATLTIDWRAEDDGRYVADRGTIWEISCTVQR